MSCRSCGFENMRNSRVCARCGAKLVWDGAVRKKDFLPERGNNALFRRFYFRCRRLWTRVASAPPFGFMRRIPPENIRRGYASVIPGMGLWMAGQTVHAIGVLTVWALTIALTVLGVRRQIYLATYGPGLAALIHAYAVIAAVRPVEFCRKRLEAILIAWLVSAIVFSVYMLVSYCIFRNMAFTSTIFRTVRAVNGQ